MAVDMLQRPICVTGGFKALHPLFSEALHPLFAYLVVIFQLGKIKIKSFALKLFVAVTKCTLGSKGTWLFMGDLLTLRNVILFVEKMGKPVSC